MKKGMKVFSGLYGIRLPDDEGFQIQKKALVATTSQKKAAEIAETTVGDIQKYWGVTGNKSDIALAMSRPDTLMIKSGGMFQDGEWKSLDGWRRKVAGR